MIKTGVHSMAQIEKSGLDAITAPLGGRRKISVTLYPSLTDHKDADDIAEAILHQFTDGRKAFKRTYARRFPEFDRDITAFLASHFPADHALQVHDVAVSDGRTAVDFFTTLTGSFPALSYHASDYNPILSVVERDDLRITLDNAGNILEICRPPFVFNRMVRDSYKYYPLNHLILLFMQMTSVPALMKAYKAGDVSAKKFFLVAPQATKLAQDDRRFVLGQHDILQPFAGQYDVIRAMNVLNLDYFSVEEFRRIAGHLHAALKEDGILVTGSNQDPGTPVDGAIYRRTAIGFEEIKRFGNGSYVHHIITAGA